LALWRCFASGFYRDTEAVMKDLLDTLSRFGIEPAGRDADGHRARRYTEHRVMQPPPISAPAESLEAFELRLEELSPPTIARQIHYCDIKRCA
jgi:hypothetical protein